MLDGRMSILTIGAASVGVGICVASALSALRRPELEFEANLPSVTASFVCSICLETVSDEEAFEQESCSHKLCRDCGRNYVLHEMDARRIPIQCCVCTTEKTEPPRGIIAEHEAFLVLEPKEQERYLRFALEATFMSQAKNLSKCPAVDCGGVFFLEDDADKSGRALCQICMKQWCHRCGSQNWCDKGVCCRRTRADKAARGDAATRKQCHAKGYKACPACGEMIERREGCNNILCRCGARMCYECGKELSKDKTIAYKHFGRFKIGPIGHCLLFPETWLR